MNRILLLTFCCCIFASISLFSQTGNAIQALNFKLELMSDNMTWGVFVIPGEGINPSTKTSTGSGQVTLVTPVGFSYANFRNHGGTWIENARVNGPMESPDKSYISFGFVTDEPKIMLYPNEETLLFTFTTFDAKSDIYLIDNINDPFAAPNSYGSNPGNDLGILDFGIKGGMKSYAYNLNVGETGQAGFARQNNSTQQPKAILAKEKNNAPVKTTATKIND